MQVLLALFLLNLNHNPSVLLPNNLAVDANYLAYSLSKNFHIWAKLINRNSLRLCMRKALSCSKRKMTVRDKSHVCDSGCMGRLSICECVHFMYHHFSFSNSYLKPVFPFTKVLISIRNISSLSEFFFSLNFVTYFASFGDLIIQVGNG